MEEKYRLHQQMIKTIRYCKNGKNLDTEMVAVIILKFEQCE